MFDSLEDFSSLLYEKTDDIIITIGIYLCVRIITKWLYWMMRTYFRYSAYFSGCVHFVFYAIASVLLLTHVFGGDIALSLFSGFSIGVGYAVQPYIISLIEGVYLSSKLTEKSFKENGSRIMFNDTESTVKEVGLLYVHVSQKINGSDVDVYIPHAAFNRAPLILCS